jgi:phosphoglycolate phosphatase
MSDLRLVIFDVDGTLVDSQADIVGAMGFAFEAVNEPVPARSDILSIVGLSLDVAMQRLAPDLGDDAHQCMVQAYKDGYVTLRAKVGAAQSSPLYPGAMEALQALHAQPEVLLGVATGKSRRGLDKLIEAHNLGGYFVTQQVADTHPSKPHPSMIWAAMQETGLDTDHTVMVGDTTFDMEMARAAGVPFVGVSWGYHAPSKLHDAVRVLDHFDALPKTINTLWRQPA